MKILDQIKEVRSEGLALASAGNFEGAIEKYDQIIKLADEKEDQISKEGMRVEDILAIAYSELGYCYRQQDEGNSAIDQVTTAIGYSGHALTFSARGRAHEEAGLVERLMEYNHIDATEHTREALRMYERAMDEENDPTEELVMDREERQSKLFRAYGLFAVNLRDLARQEAGEGPRRSLLEEAVLYAEKETKGRDELGETNSNAYHVLGAIQGELILTSIESGKKFTLKAARLSLTKAKEYAKTPREIANIKHAIFAAERNHNPMSLESVAAYRSFLDTFGDLSSADVREFKDEQKLYEDAKKLGGPYLEETTALVEAKINK
jgi:tetratricopeptide (TPR) repeat protein